MDEVYTCGFTECYYNHNFKHTCFRDTISLDFSGTCEYIMFCDEYACDQCCRYDVCDKEKKHQFDGDSGNLN